jgi:integrase
MPTHYDPRNNRWRYTFNQVINGERRRHSKLLPKAWTRDQAKAFDQAETARIFGIATGHIKARVLIQTAVDVYVYHRCAELKTGDATIKELNILEPYFRDRYLDELLEVGSEYTRDAREGLCSDPDKPPKPMSPATIKTRLAYLRAACRYAQKNHGIGDRQERLEVPAIAVRNERQIYATRADMLRICRGLRNTPAEREARALVRLAFYSGMRLGEFIAMASKNKVVEGGFLLRDTKNGEDRVAPMHPRLRVLLRYLPFKFSKIWLQRLVRRGMDKAELNHMHLHDLRHGTASALVNNGVDLHIVGAILGHKDARSTKRYSHLNPQTLNSAVLRIK